MRKLWRKLIYVWLNHTNMTSLFPDVITTTFWCTLYLAGRRLLMSKLWQNVHLSCLVTHCLGASRIAVFWVIILIYLGRTAFPSILKHTVASCTLSVLQSNLCTVPTPRHLSRRRWSPSLARQRKQWTRKAASQDLLMDHFRKRPWNWVWEWPIPITCDFHIRLGNMIKTY